MVVSRVAAFLLLVAASPVLAQEGDATVASPIAFSPVVERAIEMVILPGYIRLAEASTAEVAFVRALCADPAEDALSTARGGFVDLVEAWSGVEMFRFGPARVDNRHERLFFWPDPRGRGLAQVQQIVTTQDPSAISAGTLRGKSVAVQGILALEYVLFGTGSEVLAVPGDGAGAFRCAYAAAIAETIAGTADDILADWRREDGYADLMRKAGPDDPVYRSHGEVVQELIKAAREQTQLVRDQKLAMPAGATPAKAQPKRAPLWRSDLTLDAIAANLDAVVALTGPEGIGAALPANNAWAADQVAFQIGHVDEVLDNLSAADMRWEVLAADEATHADLLYTLTPLADVVSLLETDYPAALGLITGFNSLDGD